MYHYNFSKICDLFLILCPISYLIRLLCKYLWYYDSMKKLRWLSVIPFVATLGVLTVVTLNKNFIPLESQTDSYTLTLNSSNCGFIPTSRSSGQSNDSNSPTTIRGNRITFAYTNAMKQANYAMNIKASTGSISNVTALTGLYSITVNYVNGACQLSYGNGYNNYTGTIDIESGVRYELNYVTHFKITASGSSNTSISNITAMYSCGTEESLPPVITHTHHGYHYLAKEATATSAGNKEFYACEECQYVSLTKEDSGTYVDTVLAYDLPSTHIAYLAPLYNLHNEYLRQPPQYPYPIAVNMELPNSTYNFDKTGSSDCSATLQQALDALALQGGGTVYIPTGKYKLSNHLIIPNRVTLVGDFYGPDASNYGTVFLCCKPHDSSTAFYNDSQIHIASNAAINGFTFYYPNQDINDVVEYGYTISVFQNAAANLANLFFINSYKGISINDATSGGGELCNIENVYGTFLENGILGYSQTDVGYWSNINMSPSYYANAITQYRCGSSSTLYEYTRTHLTALTLGDLDDYGLNHINIDNAEIGIYFPAQCVRSVQAYWGFLNDINLTDCLTGVICRGTYSRGAAVFTHSSLGYVVNTAQYGMLKLAKCRWDKLLGDGKTIIETGSETYEAAPTIDESHTFNIPNYLYYFDSFDMSGATDISVALQTEINKIYTGGLIVLKNGTYRLDNPITIPDNTMITSFSASYTRSAYGEDSNELVKFISYSDDACVKLGNNSGINGIRIYNANKDPDMARNKLSNSQSDSFVAVKALGNNSFAINTEASYTFTGFDFSGINNHYIKYCYGDAYQTFIKAGGSGKIIASLSNMSFISRASVAAFAVANVDALEKYALFETDGDKLDYVRDMQRDYATMIVLNNSSDELLFNCFTYGYKCLIETNNSNVLAVNTSIDYLKDDNYAYIVNGGDVTVVNTFRVFGKSFNRISGHLKMYGRFDFTLKKEIFFDSNISTDDPYSTLPSSGLTTQNLSGCENTTGVSGATRNTTYKHGGSASWRASNRTNPAISYTFSAIDISSFFSRGYLRFYVYVQNIANKGNTCTVELTSSGTCDEQEISFNVNSQIKATGWNEVVVELSEGSKGSSTEFDRTAVNYFRFYALSANNCYYYIDDIDFLYETDTFNGVVLNECETTTNMAGASLSEFAAYGDYCWKTNDSYNTVFQFTFASQDISSYMSTGYLCFYFYCEDRTKLGTQLCVELTSSGTCDQNEITLDLNSYVTRDGWNEIRVPLSSMVSGSSTAFNPAACNFFRLFTLNSGCYFYLDRITIVK